MIYLEPRSTYDAAILQEDPKVIYDYEKLINLLCKQLDCDWLEAVDFYCFNIEPLTLQGLLINDD